MCVKFPLPLLLIFLNVDTYLYNIPHTQPDNKINPPAET